MAKRLCLVDDLKMLKITMSNTSSRNKLNPRSNHLEDVEVRKGGLLLGMRCMYDAYNKHGDYPVTRLEIDSFDETAHVDNNIDFWRKFVAEYFAPNGRKIFCISLYGNGSHTIRVFHQILKKKPKNGSKNAKPITKTEDCESFFNFFNTTQVPEDEDDIDKEESKPMTLEEDDDDDDDDEEIDDEDEEDANDADDEEDDEDEEEGKSKKKTKPFTRKRGGVPSTGTGGEERPPERKEQ
ncbi:transcriptional corepressor SEUSS [Tanacetum coccineum]